VREHRLFGREAAHTGRQSGILVDVAEGAVAKGEHSGRHHCIILAGNTRVSRLAPSSSAPKLIRPPLPLGEINVPPPSANPSAIASSTAPANAAPDASDSTLVTAPCRARSRTLSGGICTVCVSAGDVLTAKPEVPS